MADVFIQPNDVYVTLDLQLKNNKPIGRLEVNEDGKSSSQ